jgi:hypothetical protein
LGLPGINSTRADGITRSRNWRIPRLRCSKGATSEIARLKWELDRVTEKRILVPQSCEFIGTVDAVAFARKRSLAMRFQFTLPLEQKVAPQPNSRTTAAAGRPGDFQSRTASSLNSFAKSCRSAIEHLLVVLFTF